MQQEGDAQEPSSQDDTSVSDENSSNGNPSNDDISSGDSSNNEPSGEDSFNENPSNENPSGGDASNDEPADEDSSNVDSSNDEINNEDNTQDTAADEEAAETPEEAVLEEAGEELLDEESVDVTPLKYGESNTLTLPAGDDYVCQWYSFTAPEAGYYNFHATSDSYAFSMDLYDSVDGNVISYIYDNNMYTDYMTAGEIVFIEVYGYNNSEDVTVNLTVRKLTSYSAEEQEDGSYSFDAGDYTLSISTETGYGTLLINAAMAAKGDNVLADNYRLLTAYKKTDSNGYRYSSTPDFSANQNYKSKSSISADSGAEYSLYFILLERDDSNYNDYNVLGRFDADIVLNTKYTSEAAHIYDTITTESSITFDIEIIRDIHYCYYAPAADESAEEERMYIYNGWNTCSFTGLQPGTEYYFQFTDYNGKVVFETTAATATETTVLYSAGLSEDNVNLVLKADVSGYKGSASSASLIFEFTNAFNMKEGSSSYKDISNIEADENGAKSFEIEASLPNMAFEAANTYDITMWLHIGDLFLPKEVKTIEIPAAAFNAEAVTFTVEQNDTVATTADYTVEIDSLENNVQGRLYYRQEGEKDYNISSNISLSPSNKSETGVITDLHNGVEYEFVLLVGGVKKVINKTLGTASVTVESVGEGETNAFDFVRTYKVKGEGELTGEYSLNVDYYNLYNNSFYWYSQLIAPIALNAENNYQGDIKTASSKRLDPDTDYDLRLTLKDASNNTVYVLYETVHTAETSIILQKTESSVSSQKYQVSLDSKDIANFASFSTLYLNGYIRKAGSAVYRQTHSVQLGSYNSYSSTITFSGLEENTEYEIVLRTSDGVEYAADTFKTPSDTRALSDAGVYASYTTADVSAVFSGNDQSLSSYIFLFYKEKGTSNWIKARYNNYNDYYYTSNTTANYNNKITGLASDTTYDYAIVISDDYECSSPNEVADGSKKKAGEFTTKKCNYTFEFATVEDKLTYNTAVITVTAKGSADDDRLNVKLILNNGQEQDVTLKKAEDYKSDVTFTNLLGETKYTITSAVIRILEDGSYVDIAVNCGYEFTTKRAEIPTSIQLSKDELALNALYYGYSYDGYNSAVLKAEVSPATAAKDFIWRSSDNNVAMVYDDGEVVARGTGTAVITVESAYDPTIKASCAVTVKKYAAGHKNANEAAPDIVDEYYSGYDLYKNSYVENFGLYELGNDGNVTLLSGYTVTSANPRVAEWKDGSIYANTVGVTSMTFEKDGIKANLMINVITEGKGFGITGFDTYSDYPAIKGTDGSYTLAYAAGISYTAIAEISPKQDFDPTDFSWTISDTSKAEVSSRGVITPKSAGDVELTVEPLKRYTINGEPYKKDNAKVTLHIKNLPTQASVSPIYALANVNTKIGDVKFPESWGSGWAWKYPDTPLVTNGVYTNNIYSFEAVYNGTDSYPCETTLSVYIGRITGANVTELVASGKTSHNQVLETGTEDAITLSVSPVYQGSISSADYTVEIPSVSGLTITDNKNGTFNITASKKGNYTLKPVIKAVGKDKVLAGTTYKLKVVEEKQVGAITLTLADGTDENVKITSNTIVFNKVEDKKDFTLKAEVKDRYGAASTTALTWNTTDKAVAAVAPASKTDTTSAKVTVKGDGHAVISVTAKDAAGFTTSINLEVQDHSPRVDTAKASVNIAYDYTDSIGKSYADAAGGTVEIVPVYGESLTTVELRDQSGDQTASNLKIEQYGGTYKYLVQPSSDSLAKGTYNCNIYVKTSADNEYKYPVKVTVVDKAPSVSAKMGVTPNLFFKNTAAEVYLNISDKNAYISSATWEDASSDVNNGFVVNSYDYGDKWIKNKKQPYVRMSQQSDLKITNGKLADDKVAKGTLKVKISGYKKEYTFNNFTLKYSYKKPALVTKNASTNVVPSVGQNSSSFSVYDKTNKRYLYFGEVNASSSNYYYNEIICDSSDIALTPRETYSGSSYCYNGTRNSKKFNLTLDAPLWREPLTAVHTVKVIKPTAYLYYGTLTYNTNLKSTVSDWIYLKNAYSISSYTDVEIKGSNPSAQKLLDDDLFIITTSGNRITVEQSQADLMDASIPAGTYSYKVTPYYTKPGTNEKAALNTMTLKIKVIDKQVTAKVSPKGTLDLTYGVNSTPTERKNTVVLVDPKFSNLGSGYYIDDCRLTGEYSEYFALYEDAWIKYGNKYGYHDYISIKDNINTRKLKAGQAYKLAIEYTISNSDGEEITVTSNTFTIKPKQTAPKVTVVNNNQTLYVGAAGNLSRSYSLSVPSYYSISGVSMSGRIDCDKDGIADITVSGSSYLTVRINDKDAVVATASGKSYSIPITVRLVGRDGIAKDVKTTIKVKIKR